MKKWLIMALCAALLVLPVRAEKQNFATQPWSKETFPGAIEAREDGSYRYTGIDHMWFAPTARLLGDLRNLMGEDEMITVDIAFRAKVEFKEKEAGKTTLMQPVIRAYPVDGEMAKYPDLWMKDYNSTLEGMEPYFVNSGGNVMYSLPCGELAFSEDEWTDVAVTMVLTNAHLNPDMFSEWRMTLHNIRDYQALEAIDVKDLTITLSDVQATPVPTATPEPTAEPVITAEPTAQPENTTAPEITQTPGENGRSGCAGRMLHPMIPVILVGSVIFFGLNKKRADKIKTVR